MTYAIIGIILLALIGFIVWAWNAPKITKNRAKISAEQTDKVEARQGGWTARVKARQDGWTERLRIRRQRRTRKLEDSGTGEVVLNKKRRWRLFRRN